MSLRYGELFAGYGGLGMGVQSVLGGEMAWCAEFDKAPSRILAHHWPDIPNYGDVTKVDWSQVEPVDVITGGSPCQDLSHAGKRMGMKPGTRSGLWVSMLEAIKTIRPRLVVWENVRGALSAEADSELEWCAGCMGDAHDREPVLRALGRVVGDLANVGYVGSWYGLRAADVGAAHGRFRVFIFAWPADAESETRRLIDRDSGAADGPRGAAADGVTLLPTPAARDWKDHRVEVAAHRPDDADNLNRALAHPERWGDYAPAIARWETVIGRPAPAPTEPGKSGPRLSAAFVEWLMGLPAGHVTDVDISRNNQLKALGNGVVPQQAAAAVRAFAQDFEALTGVAA